MSRFDGRPADLISSRRNPLVQQVRALQQPRGRREQGLLLLEGTHLLQECRRLGLPLQRLIATSRWQQQHPTLLGPEPLQPVSPEVLQAMASTDSPDGVIALLPHPAPGQQAPSWPQVQSPLLLALDRVQDPGNLGTILRTALAAGVDRVWLGGGADPWQPKVLRASAGAALELSMQRLDDLVPVLAMARERGVACYAALRDGGQPYWQPDWHQPSLLLLGNEGSGLDPALLQQGVTALTIPHQAAVESLNVAVAAGVLLLERVRQGHDRRESAATALGA